MKLLFLDTEFTNLVLNNKLISIALVDENCNWVYAELTNTYEINDCSDFVKQNVLPYLDNKPEHQMTTTQAALKIATWIEEHNEECIIVTDAPAWDMPHLRSLLKDVWPKNLSYEVKFIQKSFEFEYQCDTLYQNGYQIHNALDDAIVNMYAWKQTY